MGKNHIEDNIKSCKNAIKYFNDKDRQISSLNLLYIEAIYDYILYNFKKKDFYTINSINYITDLNIKDFDKPHQNIYLENIKIFLMSKNIKLASTLLLKYLNHFDTNTKIETILNIIYMQGFYDELLEIFEIKSFLQKEYITIFYATLKALDSSNSYITIPKEISSVVENYIEHFLNNKKEILRMIRINIIENHL